MDTQAYSDHGSQRESQPEQSTPRQTQRSPPGSRRSSRLAKQWKLAQISASIACYFLFVISVQAFWTSEYRDCDNDSPFGQAYRAGLYSGLICIFAHATTHGTWADSAKVGTNVALTVKAKERRIVRMPMVVRTTACFQVMGATMNALAAYRTSRAPLESILVPVVAIMVAYVSLQD